MLVLTRKYQEKIRIGDNITITVLRTKGKAVRLGIEAPADVPVIRGELSFEGQPEADDESMATVAFAGAESQTRHANSTATAASKSWKTDNRPHPIDRALTVGFEPKVSLSRVPRSKVGNRLPSVVPGAAPLRAMMNERCGL
jgi:carbon storage regulator